MHYIYLSHSLNRATPSYGGREGFKVIKSSSVKNGDISNNSRIETTVHIGTHVDLPYHFYEHGQKIQDYSSDFWFYNKPLIVEIKPDELVINEELIGRLKEIKDNGFDILIVKTGFGSERGREIYWKGNYGFHPDIYDCIRERFPAVRVFGFDTISVSSFQSREIGREAHKRFLNPEAPIMLLEDMNLTGVGEKTKVQNIVIAPVLLEDCDGLPCTVFCHLRD